MHSIMGEIKKKRVSLLLFNKSKCLIGQPVGQVFTLRTVLQLRILIG